MKFRAWLVILVATASVCLAFEQEGLASWYGGKFNGRLTANGEIFDTNELTAAHKTLPFHSVVRVTNKLNDQSVIVRINDRGPFIEKRIIDLSRAAADIIGLTAAGVAPVKIEVLQQQPQSLRTIQIAAFRKRTNALATVDALTGAGLKPVVATDVADPQRPIHRVLIQGVAEPELSELRSRLAELGYPDVLVRKD
jgi:rare lipoprotein A